MIYYLRCATRQISASMRRTPYTCVCAEKASVGENDTWHVLKKLWQFSDVPEPRKVRINVAVYVRRANVNRSVLIG